MPYCPECSASVPEGTSDCPTCGAALVTTPSAADERGAEPAFDTEALGKELGQSLQPQYELLKLLGVGGMGAVFLAREPALKRLVAVKVLAPSLAADAKSRARFEREATAAAQLSHPNVVRVYSVGETKAQHLPYIIMQYVQGATLAGWMDEREKVSERDARRIVGEVEAALAAAHQRELVHRDVKPSNVLLEQDSSRAYVADFGVSAALSPEQQLERRPQTVRGMAGLAADPTHLDQYRRWLASGSLLPGLKAELLLAGWGGTCASPGEILKGPSSTRRQALVAAAEHSGIRHARPLAMLSDRVWSTPLGALASRDEYRPRGWLEDLPVVAVLRLSFCAEPW